MENKIKEFKRVEKEDILPGMKIYLADGDIYKDEWKVLDVGVPFILIENSRTHFASLYRVIDCVFVEDINKE